MSNPVPPTFDRYLRFRHLELTGAGNSAYRIRQEGVLATTFEEDHEITFYNAFHPLDGDLLEIEYPASYGYFLFGNREEPAKWKYTQKSV